MGDQAPTSDYYAILEVPRTATLEEIRRSYRRLALQNHPDKNPNAPPGVFANISKAWGVLGDPKKKEVYDKYGESGLAAYEQYGAGAEAALGFPLARYKWALALLCLAAGTLLLAFPSMIVVKLDGVQTWSWPVVFIPMFILVGVFFLLFVASWLFSGPDDFDSENSEEEISEEEAAVQAEEERIRRLNADNDGTTSPEESPAQKQRRLHEENKKKERFAKKLALTWARLQILLLIALAIAFLATVAVKLEGASFTWSEAFIPWFIFEAFGLVSMVLDYVNLFAGFKELAAEDAARAASNDNSSDVPPMLPSLPTRIGMALKIALFPVCRSLTAALVACKLDLVLGNTSWGLILLPLYGSVFIGMIVFIIKGSLYINSVKRVAPPDSEEAKTTISFKTFEIVLVAFFSALFFSFIAVLIVRLEAEWNGQAQPPSATGGVLFWPILAVTGVAALLLSCIIPICICCSSLVPDGDEPTQQPETSSVPKGLIEYKVNSTVSSESAPVRHSNAPSSYGSV